MKKIIALSIVVLAFLNSSKLFSQATNTCSGTIAYSQLGTSLATATSIGAGVAGTRVVVTITYNGLSATKCAGISERIYVYTTAGTYLGAFTDASASTVFTSSQTDGLIDLFKYCSQATSDALLSWYTIDACGVNQCNGTLPTLVQMSNTPITTCSATFTDPAGCSSNYSNNQDFTQTFCPSSSGSCINVQFTSFALQTTAGTDYLRVYDGNSTAAPLIGTYYGTTNPGLITPTNTNTSGCLTFVFHSDGATNAAGWVANVTCGTCPVYCPTGTCPSGTTCNATTHNCEPNCNASTTTVPSNECVANAALITNCGTSFYTCNYNATEACACTGDPQGGGFNNDLDCNVLTGNSSGGDVGYSVESDIWYKFCPTATGAWSMNINPSLCSTTSGYQYAIFYGTPTNLTLVAGGTNGMNITTAVTVNFNVTQTSECYFIQIDGYGGTECVFAVNVGPTVPGPCNLAANGATICSGSTASLTASGTAGSTFNWYTAASGGSSVYTGTPYVTPTLTTTTSYWVTETIGGIEGTRTEVVVTVNPSPTITGTLSACVGSTSSLTGSATAHSSTPWSSSNTAVATVNSSGVVTGVSGGTSTITYMNTNGCTTTATFTVFARPNTPTGTLSACVGGTSQLTGSGTSHATTPWTSSNTGVATVNGSGLVTAVSAGNSTITYMNSNGCTSTATFTVNANPSTPTGTLSACVGGTSQLTGSGTAHATTPWTSSNTGVATVNGSGLVTAVTAGNSTITYMNSGGCTSTVTFTVNANPSTPTGTLSACVGGTSQLTGSGTAHATTPWTSSNSGVATVNGSGLVTAVTAGNSTITYMNAAGCTVSATFTVNANPTVLVSGTNSICNGQSTSLSASGASTFAWSPSGSLSSSSGASVTATPTVSTLYTIIGTNGSSCSSSTTYSVTVNDNPTAINFTTTDASCGINDGTVTITGTVGGTAAYQYNFNNLGLSGTTSYGSLGAISYPLVVRDQNGCTFSTFVNINNAGGPTAVATTVVADSCGRNTGEILIGGVTNGNSPYTYSVDGSSFTGTMNYTDLAFGSHSIVVKDNSNCSFSTSVNISALVGPTGFSTSNIDETCGSINGSIEVTAINGGTAAFTYSINNGAFVAGPIFSNLASGTYTIAVKDLNTCVFSNQVSIINIGGPTAIDSTIVNATCGSSNGSITLGSVTGGVGADEFNINGGAYLASNSFSGLSAATYTIGVKDDNGCVYSTQITVGNSGGPSAISNTIVNATCGLANGSITIDNVTGGVVSYQYSLDDVTYSPTNTFTNLAAGNYTIYVQDGNLCGYSEAFAITQTDGPTDIDSVVVNSTCGGSNGSVNITAVNGGILNYIYDFNNLGASSNTTYSGLSAGSYPLVVVDGNSCAYSTTIVIGGTPSITAIASNTTNEACSQSNGTIDIISVTGGTSGYLYSINGGSFGTTSNFTGLAANTYTIDVQDAVGCSFNQVITVAGTNGPSAMNATVIDAGCSVANGSITVDNVTGGTPNYSYGINAGTVGVSNSFTNLSAGTYTVEVVDANSCSFTTTYTVNTVSGPTGISPTVVDAGCTVASGSINVGGVTGGTPAYNYGINGGALGTNDVFSSLSAGTYTITVSDANVCTYTTTVVVGTVNGPTAAVVNVDDATCGNSNGIITVGLITGGTSPYQYSLNAGTLTTNNVFTGLNTTTTYTIGVVDAAGCLFVATPVNVNDIAGPSSANITPTDATCGNNNGSISISVVGGTPNYQYSIDGTNYFTSNVFSNLSASTPYTVSITDANNCPLTLAPVTLNNIAGPTTAATTTVSTTCGNSNGVITVGAVTGGTPAYTYSIDGGAFVSSNAFTNLSSTSPHVISIKDANGCTVVLNPISISNVAGPTSIDSSITLVSCGAPNGGFVINSVTGGTGPYLYNINNQGFSGTTSISNLSIGSYPVVVQDANGCVYNTSVSVTGSSALSASFTASPLQGITPLAVNFNNTSSTGVNYNWSFGNGASATTYNAQQTFTTVGVYNVTLIVTNSDPLCSDTATTVITVLAEPSVVVPNIFSPNGDGVNDVLNVQSSGYKTLNITVFNRWGTKVADFDAINSSWSGDNNSEGTYFYILTGKRIDDKEFESHGAIMIVK